MTSLAERVAILEKGDADTAREIAEIKASVRRVEDGQQAILRALSERTGMQRVLGHALDVLKFGAGAAAGALLPHWFGGGALTR